MIPFPAALDRKIFRWFQPEMRGKIRNSVSENLGEPLAPPVVFLTSFFD